MAIQTLSLAPTNNSDVNFRAWGQGISNALAAAGLVKTADTGQVDWATVTRPTGVQQMRGYEVWRFDDALQATRPVFVKVEYGSNISYLNVPQVNFTIGTATDGAGTLSAATAFPGSYYAWGWGSALTLLNSSSINDWSTTTANPFYVASDAGSSMMLAGWWAPTGGLNGTYGGGLFLVERTRDPDGTVNGNGLFVIARSWGNGQTVWNTTIPLGRAPQFQYGVQSGVPTVHGGPQGQTTGLVGATLNVFPVFTGFSPELGGPSKHLVAVHAGDQGVNTEFPVTIYGEAATFRSIGTYNIGWSHSGGSSVTGAFRVA